MCKHWSTHPNGKLNKHTNDSTKFKTFKGTCTWCMYMYPIPL